MKLEIDITEKQAQLLSEFLNAVTHTEIAEKIPDRNDALDVVVAVERVANALASRSSTLQ